MQEKEISPLLPKKALEYFLDGESGNRLYLRATSIRICLENVVDTIFVHILNDEQKKGFHKKNLCGRLSVLSDFFPDEKSVKMHNIRKIGNKGAHPGRHKELNEENLDISIEHLSQICEWTIAAYFVKKGFTEHPWIPTVFSTLPPIYRIRILEEVLDSESKKIKCVDVINHLKDVQSYHEQVIAGRIMPKTYDEPSENEKSIGGFLLLIDKLAMAYLKNREWLKSMQFVEGMHDKGYVNDLFKEQMLDKLESISEEIDFLPISANLEETRGVLDKILPAVKKEEESLFITLFAVITSQSS
jgi:hypothetical protein